MTKFNDIKIPMSREQVRELIAVLTSVVDEDKPRSVKWSTDNGTIVLEIVDQWGDK